MFVDTSGRRRRLLRLVAYGFGLAGLAYTVLVAVSFAGGPVGPETLVPFTRPTNLPSLAPATDVATTGARSTDHVPPGLPDAASSTAPA